jgi:hypothetical protein
VSIDYRKLVKDVVRGACVDIDHVPLPIYSFDEDDIDNKTDEEMAEYQERLIAYIEILRELQVEYADDIEKHGRHPDLDGHDPIETAIRAIENPDYRE